MNWLESVSCEMGRVVSITLTTNTDHHREEFTFDRLGVRVPAILVSPCAPKGVTNTVFDHTSLLRYLVEKWQLGSLGARVADPGTNSIGTALLTSPRTDTMPAQIPSGRPGTTTSLASSPATLPSHQSALLALSQFLESMTDADPHDVAARSKNVLTGTQSQIDVAVERAEAFLDQQRNRFVQEISRKTATNS